MGNKIINTLSERAADGHLLTVQPGGNYGDTLIYQGMTKLLDSAELEWNPLSPGNARTDSPRNFYWLNPSQTIGGLMDRWRYFQHRLRGSISAIYIHGGGNFNDLWGAGIDCLRVSARVFDCPIVVGPQSVRFQGIDPSMVFRNISNDVHFFCRETYSYDIMQQVEASSLVQVELDDDTALHLTPADLELEEQAHEYSLMAFRNDKESANPKITRQIESPMRIQDISAAEPEFNGFVDAVTRAGEVHTDRLHVGILGALYGKSVVLYDNSYHKNRGVYEYSLEDYPNVEFETLR